MRAPSLLFWLWLVYSGLITWCSTGQVSAVSQSQGVTTESPIITTTDNPTYTEAYDDDTELESVTEDSVLPTTTLKTGRNFGSRIRGINSLPYGVNSVSAGGSSSSSSNNDSQPILRPRPTSSVISYNPTNYNRVLKRRKNTTTPSTLLTYKNIQSNSSFNNNVSANRTRSIGSVTNSSNVLQGSSQQNSSGLHKVIIRKRPRPVTINDALTTSVPLTPSTTEAPSDLDIASSTDPETTHAPGFNLPTTPTNNSSGNGNSSNSVNSSRSEASGRNNVSLRPRTRVRVSPVITPSLPSNALEAQPVSHSPVSSVPSFEYNPSVSIKDGVYRFRYSEPTYSSKRVHKEEFGVSHVTYGSDEDEDPDRETETTTYAPPEDTTRPFQIDIDGSEEDFTSSLPPAYREYFNKEDNLENQRRAPPINLGNVPIPSIREPEPVTVTVTHTVVSSSTMVKSTRVPPTVVETSTSPVILEPEPDNSHANTIPIISGNANVSVSRPAEDESNQENVIRSTPKLPSLNSIQVSTSNASWTYVNQSAEVSSSSPPTTEALNTSEVVNKSNVIAPAEASIVPSVTNGHDEQHGQGTDHASVQPHNININGTVSPTVSSKIVTSVYFTKEENPYYTTSSYSFSASTVYSYGDPHDGHDDHDHDHGHPDHDHAMDNSQKQQELRPTTAYWDSLGYKSATFNQSQYPDSSASNSSDQDIGYSTPEAETEYPPHSFGDRTTTPMPDSDPDDHSEADNEIDDNGTQGDYTHSEDGTVDVKQPRPNAIPNDLESLVPSVPVFIQVLLDMPAHVFCLSISGFKQMIARVYEPERHVTPDQVIVFNEQNCNNVTGNLGNYTHTLNHSGIIKYATTTASVTKTLSSSTARSVSSARASGNNSSTLPSFTGVRLRNRRHGQDKHLVPYDTRENEINETDVSESLTLYPVFFYLNNKNGSYDQLLTESFIQLWNVTKDSNHSMFFDKIRKVEMVSPTQEMTSHAPDNENSGIIAAITIASIAAICLVLLGVLLVVMRHRQAQTKFAKRCTPVSLDDYSLDNISVYNSFRRKQRNRASKRSYTNAAFDDPNAPSRLCNAVSLTTALQDETKLEEEFRDLPSVNPTMDDIPTGAETKNRYANVIPMPDTRVLLTFQEDIPNSDYINANFVRGPMSTSKGYIITQAPLEDTIVDFWRMVWEQQIRVIMMLTDFSEAGIPKCSEYYPRSETVDSSQLHGDFQITLEKRDITENCITSYLVIKDMERNLRRDVIHLWYHSWPDKGVPSNPKCTMDFLLKSRKFTKEPTPVLVHCSPGTGRSGTVVACDVAMREYDSQHNVNIPRTVMKIRQDRAGAVQTKDQYLHIYQVVQSYASRTATQLDSI
ncbi:unnamed protein product [Allacma fusca]|uniref:protein-tyrosine-phosphatase n=1 Tax=Allacma fusca TaxID=39272 RepID=A0A8J2NW30_9HEXA|nr:unnamed protein product [Allacma fusca]